jgi:hypothetical protein
MNPSSKIPVLSIEPGPDLVVSNTLLWFRASGAA